LNNYSLGKPKYCWYLLTVDSKKSGGLFLPEQKQWINVAKADFLEMLQQVIVLAFVVVSAG